MKKLSLILIFFIICGLLPGEIRAQKGRYDTATVQTISGQVTAVETLPGKRGFNRLRLQVSSPEGVIPVLLGPANFIQQQNFAVAVGDKVTVTGSRVARGKRFGMILASEVQKDSQVLKLRDPAGVPLWGGKPRIPK